METFHKSADQQEKYRERSLNKAVEVGRLHSEDLIIVREYLTELAICNNLTTARQEKNATTLMSVIGYLPRVHEIRLADCYSAFEQLKRGKRARDGEPLSPNSIADFSRALKRFLLWLIENKYIEVDEAKIKKIRVPAYKPVKTEANVFEPEEITQLVKATKSLRYKALIAVVYEAGLRIHEAAALRWGDVTFTDWGCRIRTAGKTGKTRIIPVIAYREVLAKWQSEHPNPDPEELVFLSNHNKPLRYASLVKTIRKFACAAGIEREFTPHDFRHSRITHVLRDGLPETHAKKLFWGNLDSNMISTYAHLTEKDNEDILLELAGVQTEGHKREPSLQPMQCDQCLFVNPPGSRLCAQCGRRFSAQVAVEISDVQRAVDVILQNVDNPDVFTAVLQARAKMLR
jgi:integrase